jgi:triosephosphate isomerase
MRQKFIAGNWKMFGSTAFAEQLASGIVKGVGAGAKIRVAICPPFPYLAQVGKIVAGTPVALGAQNCYHEKEGAFTGETSPVMLKDVGCTLVILGHSERRAKLGESDTFINKKVHAALAAGLEVILCIGETLDDRNSGRMEQVLDTQLTGGLAGVSAEMLRKIVVAYEPVWAIGTGVNATPQQAQDAHVFIRKKAASLCGAPAAENLTIQYGGSVKPDNAAALLDQPDVDGALVGGACLKAPDFLAIINAA